MYIYIYILLFIFRYTDYHARHGAVDLAVTSRHRSAPRTTTIPLQRNNVPQYYVPRGATTLYVG